MILGKNKFHLLNKIKHSKQPKIYSKKPSVTPQIQWVELRISCRYLEGCAEDQ